MKRQAVWVIPVIIIIVALVIWWLFKQPPPPIESSQPTPSPVIEAPVTEKRAIIRDPVPAAEPPPQQETSPTVQPAPIVAPPAGLTGSDATAQQAAQSVSTALMQWVAPQEQLRKWVLLIDNIAQGKVPVKNRPIEFSMPAFKVVGDDEHPIMSHDNMGRAQPLIDAMVSIDPALLARYYRAWLPLLEQAYEELGQPQSFDNRLHEAIERIRLVEPLQDNPIELERPSVVYRFKNPELEQATDVEKLLWRMGPENTRKIQLFLSKLKVHLARSA